MEKVIFDTNAYRYLVTNRSWDQVEKVVEKLKAREKARGIESLISPIVAKELLAHVANKKDPSFSKCLKAVKAMYLHSSIKDQYQIIASPAMLIGKSFFNETIPQAEETAKAMIQIAYHLTKSPTDYVFRKFQKNLNDIRDQISEGENIFAQSLKEYVKVVDPSSDTWRIFPNDPVARRNVLAQIRSEGASIGLAKAIIYPVYTLLLSLGKKVTLSEPILEDMAKQFIKTFPEYIALYKLVFENLVNSEFNMLENSRSNFFWDIQLMLNVGDHSIGNERLYFVTADKAIISTALGQNAKYTILTFKEYMEYVG